MLVEGASNSFNISSILTLFFSILSYTESLPTTKMSTKAPRIPASVWDGYREEITALYTTPDGTLEKVMDAMKARRGFQPT
jgi:hypothetical protein